MRPGSTHRTIPTSGWGTAAVGRSAMAGRRGAQAAANSKIPARTAIRHMP